MRVCVRVCVCVTVRLDGGGRLGFSWLYVYATISAYHIHYLYPRCYSEYPYNLIFESRGVNYDKK